MEKYLCLELIFHHPPIQYLEDIICEWKRTRCIGNGLKVCHMFLVNKFFMKGRPSVSVTYLSNSFNSSVSNIGIEDLLDDTARSVLASNIILEETSTILANQ